MATVNCDLKTLLSQSACFQCFSELQNQAAKVYFLNQRLAKLQGVTPQTVNQLRASAACIACTRPESVADNLDSLVARMGAVAAGAPGISTQTIAQTKAAMKGFANLSLSELRAIEVLLSCQLNAFP